MSDLVQQYIDEGRSWKYTTVLLDAGTKEYHGSTTDGDGNEIKVFLRKNVVTMSINQIAKRDGITTKEAYKKYGISVFRTTNAQSSIRTRIIDYKKEMGIDCQYLSIEYVPKTGKNRGKSAGKDAQGNALIWKYVKDYTGEEKIIIRPQKRAKSKVLCVETNLLNLPNIYLVGRI